jgi:hypothetical protein
MTKKANQHLLDKNVMSSPISPPPTNLYWVTVKVIKTP